MKNWTKRQKKIRIFKTQKNELKWISSWCKWWSIFELRSFHAKFLFTWCFLSEVFPRRGRRQSTSHFDLNCILSSLTRYEDHPKLKYYKDIPFFYDHWLLQCFLHTLSWFPLLTVASYWADESIDIFTNINSADVKSLMAVHTLKIRAVDTILDTIKEKTNIGSIWRKMYMKRSIGITTLVV